MESGKVKLVKNWKGMRITFEDVPAEQCKGCGELYLEPGVVGLMEVLTERALEVGDLPEVMNVREVAKYLRVSKQTVYNLLKSGKLSAVKVGREWRFPKSSVVRALRIANEDGDLDLTLAPVVAFRTNSRLSEDDKDRLFAHVLDSIVESDGDEPKE